MNYQDRSVSFAIIFLFVFCLVFTSAGSLYSQDEPNKEGITSKQAEAFALQIQLAIVGGKPELFNSLVDWDYVIKTATKDFENYTGMKEIIGDFRIGVNQGVTDPQKGMVSNIVHAIGANGDYRFLRYHVKEGMPYILFRMVSEKGGVNYHDMLLGKAEDGSIRIKNILVALTGEYITQALNRSSLPFVQRMQSQNEEKLTDEEKVIFEDTETIINFIRNFNNSEKVLELYGSLPEEYKNSKHAVLMRMNAAYTLQNMETYKEAIDLYHRLYPDSPTVDLLQVDQFTLKGDLQGTLNAIDSIEKIVGKDAQLDNLRSEIYYKKGDYKQALSFAEKAVEEEPTLVNSYWTVLGISLKMQNYDLTAKYLTLVENKLNIPLADLSEIPEYAGFVASEQYKTWVKSRKKNEEIKLEE